MENKAIKEAANNIYNSAFLQYGDDSRSVLWGDQQRQYTRFNELIQYVDLNDSSKELLEVGCGTADLYNYLKFHGYRGQYKGYDINENLLNIAKRKNENIDVELFDIIEQKSEKRYDYVLMSGVFNSNMGQDINWVREFVMQMFGMCRNHIAFNALSSAVNYKHDSMFYLDPSEMLKFCIAELSKRVTILHHNLPYNYTVVVFKDEDF